MTQVANINFADQCLLRVLAALKAEAKKRMRKPKAEAAPAPPDQTRERERLACPHAVTYCNIGKRAIKYYLIP